jgi:two-component system, cell cycle sensor histidine kinase and response regulator CckA
MQPLKGGDETILVVDDNAIQCKLLSHLLGNLGYHVETVRRGEDAVAFLLANRADLLLLDVVLENGIDGIETYRRVLEMNPGQKALVMTGFAETEQITELIALGIKTWARKPLTLERLASTIRQELDRRDA